MLPVVCGIGKVAFAVVTNADRPCGLVRFDIDHGGAFHPKMWALRFTPLRPEDPARLRLLVLSRNLTRDRSWHIAATLDGVISKQPKAINRPVADFLRQLPDLATVGAPDGTKALVDELAEDIRRAEWSLPEPFESISFAINGLGGKPWRPEPCVRLGVVSPFCDDQTLSLLASLPSAEKPLFIGRSDELAQVSGATLDGFAREKLRIHEPDAQTVRTIFERFTKIGSATKLAMELRQAGIVTRTGLPANKGFI